MHNDCKDVGWYSRAAVLPVLINYDVTLRIWVKGLSNLGRYTLKGKHDGYPSYIVNISGTPINDHEQKNLISLLGSGDIKVNERGSANIQ